MPAKTPARILRHARAGSARAIAVVVMALAGALSPAAAAETGADDAALAAGKATYQRYCALCHGLDGRGAGPLSDALKAKPADLTTLSRREGGKFPAGRFAETVWTGNLPGHGKSAMLEWSRVFGADQNQLEATATILDLTIYVETLQAK